MSDIITAENLPLVLGALFTGLAGLAAWKTGGTLGSQAKSEKPPSPDVTVAGGLIMSNMGSRDMVEALFDIAAAVREATTEAKEYRTSKTASMLERMQEQLDKLAAHEAKAATRR